MGISFVIPVHNEQQFIANVLQRIFSLLENRAEFEVIVIDNASSDDSLSILKTFPDIDLVALPCKYTVSAVRNIGWQQASYEIVAFIDGDVLITPQWVEEILSVKDAVLEKEILMGATYGLSERPGWIETSWFAGMKCQNRKYINGGNLIASRTVLKQLNGFNEQLISAEDVDICQRASRAGIDVCINGRLLVLHEGYPKNWSAFFRRELWHGVGDMQSFRRFIKSKTALVAVFQISLLLLSVIAMLVLPGFWGIGGVVAFTLLNVALVFKKFNVSITNNLLQLFALMSIYHLARCLSIFRRHWI